MEKIVKSKNTFNLLEYVYYRHFLFYLKYESKLGKGNAKNRGAFYIALYLTFNIIAIESLLEILIMYLGSYNGLMLHNSLNTRLIIYTVLFIGLVVFCIRFFVKNHNLIIDKYNLESRKQKKALCK